MNRTPLILGLCAFLALSAPAARADTGINYSNQTSPPARPITPSPETLAALRARAQGGDAAAQYDLGRFSERGLGVRQSYAEANKWFSKAAAQGNAEAQLRLALLYDLGEGVAPSYVEAVKWFKLAAAQGNVTAELRLGDLYADQFRTSTFNAEDRTAPLNHPEPVADYREEALKWYHKAAGGGNAEAQASLGNLYAADLGYREEAYFWLSLAAARDARYVRPRDKAASRLTPEKIAAVQKHVQEWKPAEPPAAPSPPQLISAIPDKLPADLQDPQSAAAAPQATPAVPELIPAAPETIPAAVLDAVPASPSAPPPATAPVSSNVWPPTPTTALTAPIVSLPPVK